MYAGEVEWFEFVRDDRRDTVGGALQDSAHNERSAFAGDRPIRLPEPSGTQNVDDTRFVLEVEEGDALRRSWSLSVSDQSGNLEPAVGFDGL